MELSQKTTSNNNNTNTNTEKKTKSFTLSIKKDIKKKTEIKKSSLFDEKQFKKPFEEDIYSNEEKTEQELIKEVEGNRIRAVIEKKKKESLVIPLIKTNQWRNANEENDLKKSNNDISVPSNKRGLDEDNDKTTDINTNSSKRSKHENSTTISTINPSRDNDNKNDSNNNNSSQEGIDHDDKKIPSKETKFGLQIPVKRQHRIVEQKEINKNDNSSTPNKEKNEDVNLATMSIEERAIHELMREAKNNSNSGDGHTDSTTIKSIPILQQNAVPGSNDFTSETEKYRHDVNLRPEQASLEDYERIPIEEFGAAMLRGMGWEKGKSIGRNKGEKNALINPIEFIPRPALLGLGAQPKPPDVDEFKKKHRKKLLGRGGELEKPKEYQPNITEDGKVKHFREIGKETQRSKRNSQSSELTSRHSATADIAYHSDYSKDNGHNSSSNSSRSHNHNSRSHHSSHSRSHSRSHSHSDEKKRGESSERHYSSSSLRESVTYTQSSSHSNSPSKSSSSITYTQKQTQSSSYSRNHNHSRHSSDHQNEEDEEKYTKKGAEVVKSRSKHRPSWLYPNIRVRIVSRSFKSGKYYKAKGVIVDVVQEGECILRLDDGKLLENVKERYLETIIPNVNEKIIVVRHTGKHNNSGEDYYQNVGKVLSKDRDTEKAVIQFLSNMEVDTLSFDDICEYRGNVENLYI